MDIDTSQLEALAERLRALDKVGVEIANEALPHILEEAKRTAAAGTTADGTAWAPKKDGGRPLVHAANALTAAVSGITVPVIALILRGVEVFHHRAKGNGTHGTPRRAILFDPKDGVPAKMREAIENATKRVVARTLKGGGR